MDEEFERYHPDAEALHHGFRTGPCFVCTMVQGEIRSPENIIYEDQEALVFLEPTPGPTATPWSPPRSTANR
jgi:hypothetical protein